MTTNKQLDKAKGQIAYQNLELLTNKWKHKDDDGLFDSHCLT